MRYALLDVDGPLNPYAARGNLGPDYKQYRLNGFDVWLNHTHGEMLMEWADRTDRTLVWCTTWEHDANDMIGPRVGLPKLPVIEFKFEHLKPYNWKYTSVLEYCAGEELIWFDDDFRVGNKDGFMEQRGELVTDLVWIDPAVGLTESDLR